MVEIEIPKDNSLLSNNALKTQLAGIGKMRKMSMVCVCICYL